MTSGGFEMTSQKRYYDLDSYLQGIFGSKVYKLCLSSGCTCPNRDGSISTGGCAFCSEGGSGDFAAPAALPINEQIKYGRERLRDKLAGNYSSCRFIAYFQSFTNTYAPVSHLERIFTQAINDPCICALSIGTRPDCLAKDVLYLLQQLNTIKPVWVELGLQTIHPATVKLINRGYELPVFEKAVADLDEIGIETIVHLILGLPGETREMMLDSVKYIAALSGRRSNLKGIKLQLLHILKNTEFGRLYEAGPDKFVSSVYISSPEDYISLLVDALELLPPELVIHRLTGDGPHDKLLHPLWSANKRTVLNGLLHEMKIRDAFQGSKYQKP